MKLPIFLIVPVILIGCATAPREEPVVVPLAFSAALEPGQVATGNPEAESNGHGHATLLLIRDQLHVHGAFSGLTSALRDFDKTPGNPGIFIRSGTRGQEGPDLYGLPVELNPDQRSGTFTGRFELSPEELGLLRHGRLYLSVHTERYEAGEIRGQIRPDPDAWSGVPYREPDATRPAVRPSEPRRTTR